MKTKMMISKGSLLAIKQRCLDKLDDDATDRERYLVGDYEFSNRVRDAVQSHQKMDVTFSGFSDATMDAIEDAADRLERMLASARDEHDRRTAYSMFEDRALNAIVNEFKADERLEHTTELVADTAKIKVAEPPKPAPAAVPLPPSPQPAVPATPAPVVVDRMTVEILDRTIVPDDPGDVTRELERALATPLRADPVTVGKLETIAATSPYAAYDKRVSQAWKQPPPSPPKKRKKGVQNADLL